MGFFFRALNRCVAADGDGATDPVGLDAAILTMRRSSHASSSGGTGSMDQKPVGEKYRRAAWGRPAVWISA